MTKRIDQTVQDAPLSLIKTTATVMMLIKKYTAGDSYATVVGNKLAQATMASADYTLATSGSSRTLTTATKSAAASAADADAVATRSATSGSTTTINDTTQSWTTNAFVGMVVTGVAGTGAGQKAVITANTATQVSFAAVGTAFDATTTYRIDNDHHIAFTDGSATVLWVTDETGDLANASGDTINFPALVLTSPQVV